MQLQLTLPEQQTLAENEAVIERGLKTFVEVGEALMTIREQRLYRASHRTFEDYCQDRWGMNASRARQLISAAMVTDTIANYVNESVTIVTLPATESQARPLTKLPPEQQGAAWQRAVETAPNGKVTAAHVAEVVEELRTSLPARVPDEPPVLAEPPIVDAPPSAPVYRIYRADELHLLEGNSQDVAEAVVSTEDVEVEEDEGEDKGMLVAPAILDLPSHIVEAVVKRMERDEKKAQRVEERRRAIEEASSHNATLPVGERVYRVIYADPPWSYNNTPSPDVVTPDCHYPLMTIDDICAMPVKDMAMSDAVLFLWVPSPLLVEGLRVCQAWGFAYKAMFVWDKVKHNLGHYNSVRHELLFVCVRGSCPPDDPRLMDSVVSIERTEHSRKPDHFRTVIDTLYPSGPRIELFARTAVDGWDVFGNEV